MLCRMSGVRTSRRGRSTYLGQRRCVAKEHSVSRLRIVWHAWTRMSPDDQGARVGRIHADVQSRRVRDWVQEWVGTAHWSKYPLGSEPAEVSEWKV